MNFIITVALTFIVVMLALLVFRYVGLPVYRVEAINVQRLLESVLAANRQHHGLGCFCGYAHST